MTPPTIHPSAWSCINITRSSSKIIPIDVKRLERLTIHQYLPLSAVFPSSWFIHSPRLMMILGCREHQLEHLSFDMKSSEADNCHILPLSLGFSSSSSSRRYFDPQIIVLCILALISLHHIDEYKLLLTLSDVDSFSFYVFFLSKGERRNRCIKVLSLISSDIVMMFLFSSRRHFFPPPKRCGFSSSVSARHPTTPHRLFIKLELLKLYFRV